MREEIEQVIFEYIESQYTEATLSIYDRNQIMEWIFDGINDYIERFVD